MILIGRPSRLPPPSAPPPPAAWCSCCSTVVPVVPIAPSRPPPIASAGRCRPCPPSGPAMAWRPDRCATARCSSTPARGQRPTAATGPPALVVAVPGRGGTGIPPAADPSPPGAFAALHRNLRSGDLRQPQQGGSAPNHLLLHAFNVCRLPGAGIHPLDRRLISQQRHRLWIQRYLAQGLGQGQPQARTA